MPPLRPENSRKVSRVLWDASGSSYAAFLRAILYELQPIRFSQLNVRQWGRRSLRFIHRLAEVVWRTIHAICYWIRNESSLWHAKLLAGVALYYFVVRIVHAYLEAGPILLMVTALAIIFTIGLADNERDGQHRGSQLSAYHVFNRGMQRMMGDVDANQLLAQHVGGVFYNDNRHDADDEDFRARRPQFAIPPAAGNQDDENDDDGDNAIAVPERRARRSRKKARGEQRREIQRQREAAIAAIGEDGIDEDAVAMQHIIEEQIRGQ